MKNSRRKVAGRCFLKPFFSHSRVSVQKFFVTALHDIIGLQNFSLSFCQSLSRITMCNLHWCYRTALSQSESSNFFHVYCYVCNHTRMITDRIGLLSVLLPLLIIVVIVVVAAVIVIVVVVVIVIEIVIMTFSCRTLSFFRSQR